jgi:hypothetical protein
MDHDDSLLSRRIMLKDNREAARIEYLIFVWIDRFSLFVPISPKESTPAES